MRDLFSVVADGEPTKYRCLVETTTSFTAERGSVLPAGNYKLARIGSFTDDGGFPIKLAVINRVK